MSVLTVTQLSVTAAAPGFTAAGSGGDLYPLDNRTVLHIRNDSEASVEVTVASQGTDRVGFDAADLTFAVPAGTDRAVLLGRYFAVFQNTDRRAEVTYSATTDVTIAVYRT